jgi:prophage regulatory protein
VSDLIEVTSNGLDPSAVTPFNFFHIQVQFGLTPGFQRGVTMMHTILRLPDVKRSTGLSLSTIYLRIAQGTFPKPVSLGGRAVGWLKPKSNSGYSGELKRAGAKAAARGQLWGQHVNFEL